MGTKALRRLLVIVGLVIVGGASASSASAANYGAIYLDPYNGAGGYSYNYPTLYKASAKALQTCKRYKGTRCKRVTWFRNGCGAVYWDRTNRAWGSFGGARTMYAAKVKALQQCRRHGQACRMRLAACTTRRY